MVQSAEVNPHRGDQNLCLTTCSVVLPKDTKAYCYANEDSDRQDSDQFCGYEKDGFIFGAEGCCENPCPGEECPDEPARKPEKIQSQSSASSQKNPKKPKPLPQLIKLLLIVLGILLTAAGIFVSLDI
jgi:hypothetical protein